MARTVLLTGATGFIGSNLARRLHARGDRLRCIVRSQPRAQWLAHSLQAELVVADITDAITLADALRGCDLAYHLAAIYDVGVVDAAALERTNVEGTRAFLAAVEQAAVPRAVHVSSTAALGPLPGSDQSSVREYDGPYPTVYHQTKAQAHRLAREAQQRGVPVMIACPAFVYGPGDPGPGGRFIRDLLRRRIPALVSEPGWFSFVHVDDVAHGLELIGERGTPGRTYVLSGEDTSLNDYAKRIARHGNVPAPALRLPLALTAVAARALDLVSRLTGVRLPVTYEGVVSTSRGRWLYSHERASQELGWQPRSLDAGLPETVAWFKAHLK